MLFLQYIMVNLVLTKALSQKCHAVLLTGPIFAGFCVCLTDLGVGRAVAIAASPHPWPHLPPTLISLSTTPLSRQWADLPTDLWAF
jgi:hypothetical protein